MAKQNLSTQVLIQIRDEMVKTREDLGVRIHSLDNEMVKTREDLGARIDRLERRQVESEVRLATELVSVATAIKELSKLVAEDRHLRGQVADHETRLAKLEKTG